MDPLTTPEETISELNNVSFQSHLDDSKLNNLLSNSGGALSPCTRGKTMREFEAELAELKQENFELKMQLYVMEEQKEALEDERDVAELRINYQKLMKEFEKLRNDLAEKEDLILKAGEAMSLMSKKHEEDLCIFQSKASEEIESYKQTISKLELEIIELKEKSFFMPKPAAFDDSSAMYAMAFNLGGRNGAQEAHSLDKCSELEAKIKELQDQLIIKNLELERMNGKSANLELEANQLRQAEADLKKELQFRVDKLAIALSNLTSAENQIKDMTIKIALYEKQKSAQKSKVDEGDSISQYSTCHNCEKTTDSNRKDLEKELEIAKAELADLKTERVKMMKAVQAFMKQNKCLTRENERLKRKPNESVEGNSEEKREVNARKWVTSRHDLSPRTFDALSIT